MTVIIFLSLRSTTLKEEKKKKKKAGICRRNDQSKKVKKSPLKKVLKEFVSKEKQISILCVSLGRCQDFKP